MFRKWSLLLAHCVNLILSLLTSLAGPFRISLAHLNLISLLRTSLAHLDIFGGLFEILQFAIFVILYSVYPLTKKGEEEKGGTYNPRSGGITRLKRGKPIDLCGQFL